MRKSLRAQLSLSYAILALLLVAAIIVLINSLFQNQFRTYIISQQQQKNRSIAALLESRYTASGGRWDDIAVQTIGIEALEQGIILKVLDSGGKVVWDATVHNNGMCVQMLQDIAADMHKYSANFKGGYVQSDYPIKSGGAVIGSMTAGYFGPYYFTDNDIYFLQSINKALLAAAGVSLVAALALAAFMARRISRPISTAVGAAGEIMRGNYTQRIAEKAGTQEIDKLTDTINNLADSLEKQTDLRKRMSADVAHELRTPLANLQSALEAMIDGVWKPDTERLMSCHEEILRLSRLVGDLERLERIEAENSVLFLSEFDVSELIGHVITSFEPEFGKRNVGLGFEGEPVRLIADRDKISQVLVNLLSNALKYTPEGGRVDVCLKGSEKAVEIDVADSGAGIPEEDIPFIFERFYRADKSRNKMTGGLGLGLTIAKAVVDAHKGKITVESKAGKGTVFTVLLPR